MSTKSLWSDPRSILITIIFILIIFLGIPGNTLVVIAVWKKRWLRSTTNYLILNLGASDAVTLFFSVLAATPLVVKLPEGHFSDFLCKFMFSYHVPFTASIVSILTLALIAIERYHAIVKPMRTGARLREGTVGHAILVIWIFAMLVSSPLYYHGHYNDTKQECRQNYGGKDLYFHIYNAVLVATIVSSTLSIMCFCYLQIIRDLYFNNSVVPQNVASDVDRREKQKLLRLCLTVTVFFAFFLVPFAIALVMAAFGSPKRYYKFAAILFFSESLFNPLIYALQSSNFRKAFKELLACNRITRIHVYGINRR